MVICACVCVYIYIYIYKHAAAAPHRSHLQGMLANTAGANSLMDDDTSASKPSLAPFPKRFAFLSFFLNVCFRPIWVRVIFTRSQRKTQALHKQTHTPASLALKQAHLLGSQIYNI